MVERGKLAGYIVIDIRAVVMQVQRSTSRGQHCTIGEDTFAEGTVVIGGDGELSGVVKLQVAYQ